MILTEYQKEIIDKLICGEITDIASFIKWNYDDKKVNIINYFDSILDSYNKKYKLSFSFKKYDNEIIKFSSMDLPKKCDIYFIDDFQPIGNFIALWNKLEKEEYIISTKSKLNITQLVCYMKRNKVNDLKSGLTFSVEGLKEVFDSYEEYVEKNFPNLSKEEKKEKSGDLMYKTFEQNKKELTYERANELLNERAGEIKYRDDYFFLEENNELIKYVGVYIDKQIIPLIDLKEFKKNKYQSSSDLRFKKERKERIIAQIITVLISIIALLLNFYFSKDNNNTQNQLNKDINKLYQSQEKLNNFYLKYDKLLNQFVK